MQLSALPLASQPPQLPLLLPPLQRLRGRPQQRQLRRLQHQIHSRPLPPPQQTRVLSATSERASLQQRRPSLLHKHLLRRQPQPPHMLLLFPSLLRIVQ